MPRISKISLVLLALLASPATSRAQQTPDVRVADARIEPEELETECPNFVQVARAAAGDVADAP